MGKATPIILIALAVGGFFAYRKFAGPPSEARQTYQKFADALEWGRWDEAKGLATIQCWAPIQVVYGSPAALMERTQATQMAGTVAEVIVDIESEELDADGQTVKILAKVRVVRSRSVGSNFKHTAEVKKVGAGWRISAFDEVYVNSN